MLVISRRKNESIVINNEITVTVVEIRGDKVRLGITSPKDIPVHRQEVYDAIYGGRLTREEHSVASLATPTAIVDARVSLSNRFAVEPQYVLCFPHHDEDAPRVLDFLGSFGVAVDCTTSGECRAALSADLYRRLTQQFRLWSEL